MTNINNKFDELVDLIATLRSENGCPWDREQTHQSLKRNLIEECYEVLEAIENKDTKGIVEELGDVLLQIMLHAQILSETEAVSIDDVIQGLSDKMIRRHPHVFGDESADSAEEVKQNWEVLKANEKRGQKPTENIFNIPSDLPSLHYAQILQDRAVKQGFDWDDVSGVLDKIQEEAREVTEAESYEEKEDEIGDLIFTLVNLSRRLDVHADSALRSANIKFKLRFELMVKLATEDGLEFQDLPLEVQDKYWDKAKVILRS
ncbi:MAG: nucleoside triphosphate pyrophosphohydrolase [Dehalococcoidia bacterium]